MNEEQKKALIDVSMGVKPAKDLLKVFPNEVADKEFVEQLIKNSMIKKDTEELDLILILCSHLNSITNFHSKILSDLLKENWHFKHEDVESILQKLKDPTTVDSLFN